MSLNIGDVVFYKTHPYTANDQDVKIAMYADYTTPIMVVNKKGEGEKFNTKTGRKTAEFVECIYYDSRDGKYITKRMNAEELIKCKNSYVRNEDRRNLLKDIGSEYTSVEDIKKDIEEKYIYKKVVLKTVDLELFKHKINREKENGDLVETNHLEFLPPVMTVIGCKFIEDKEKFCAHTGQAAIELKCKWYNSQSKAFSEESFRVDNLYLVDLKIEGIKSNLLSDYKDLIDGNSFHLIELNRPVLLEGTDNLVSYSLLRIESIVYKHYFYEALVFSLLKGKKEPLLIKKEIQKVDNNKLWGTNFPDYVNRKYFNGLVSFPFKEEEYYYISYTDKAKRFTKRLVKIRDIFFVIENKHKRDLYNRLGWNDEDKLSANDKKIKKYFEDDNLFFIKELGSHTITISKEKGKKGLTVSPDILTDESINILLETNCLLKNGLIRHFRLDGISEVRMINNGADLLENGIIIEEKE
ncbi:hypothetical protein HX071_01690 [Myroides marinus]|uniref:hypothetical protein n=1 Tax=Myroides marinus TaxID=703342 RepID=UPI00257743C9|nr:hypothetical protein [Myroides marinus]MDM1500915.1 hypothetical protein [Myroides marinus]